MFISLEGIDGSGKSTVTQHLAKNTLLNLSISNRKDIESNSNFVSSIARKLSEIMWYSGDGTDLSPTFWIYLQGAWHTLVAETVVSKGNILIDGWYFKFFSKLVSYFFNCLVKICIKLVCAIIFDSFAPSIFILKLFHIIICHLKNKSLRRLFWMLNVMFYLLHQNLGKLP